MGGLNVYVVSYDIMDPKRLLRVHKAMKGFGDPIHYSVFRCSLTAKGRVDMIEALDNLIKRDLDRVMIIDMGPEEGHAEDRIEFMGKNPPVFERKSIII
jgi:CRISPR-associated protein Cas2